MGSDCATCIEQRQSLVDKQLKRGTHNGPCYQKTYPKDVQPGKTQLNLHSYRDQLEHWNFACSKVNRFPRERLTMQKMLPTVQVKQCRKGDTLLFYVV